MSAKASGADASSSSARNREHQQGKQDREYTAAQKAAVDRVRKCKATAYYEILDIKVEAEDNEIKRAYKKLALVMHPDKNGAPGADEAFKLIAKAFQVLSDPQKRAAFDRTGSDPDSRGFGGGPPPGANPFAGFAGRGAGTPGRPQFTDEVSPEELFNMFFGGGQFGGPFGGGGGGGTFFDMNGGPGIRIHHFGGQNARRRQNANQEEAPPDNSLSSTLLRLLPLILIFAFSLLSSILSGGSTDSAASSGPSIKFSSKPPYTQKRLTPNFKIPFYVSPTEIANLNPRRLDLLDRHAENIFIKRLQNDCDVEFEIKQRKIQESQGWFIVDQEKLKEAMAIPLTSCQRLKDLGVNLNAYDGRGW